MRISDWSSDGCSSDLHETGTRDIRRLSGLGRIMPTTAILATAAAAAMAGVPLLNGFLSTEMFFAAPIEQHVPSAFEVALTYPVPIAAISIAVYSLSFIHVLFLEPPPTHLPPTPPRP